MTLDQFVAANNGQPIDVDHAYGAQCWDLVELYAEQVLGVPKHPWAITLGPEEAAKEAWTVFDAHLQQYFDKVPKGQEQRGDIMVYDGHGIYTEGHIAVCLGNGQAFEQNADPDGSPAHVATRANTYLLGSLRLKGEDMGQIQDLQQQVADLQAEVDLARSQAVDENNQIASLTTELTNERQGYQALVTAAQAVADEVGVAHGAGDVDMNQVLVAVTALKQSTPSPSDPNTVVVTKDGLWAAIKRFLGIS